MFIKKVCVYILHKSKYQYWFEYVQKHLIKNISHTYISVGHYTKLLYIHCDIDVYGSYDTMDQARKEYDPYFIYIGDFTSTSMGRSTFFFVQQERILEKAV